MKAVQAAYRLITAPVPAVSPAVPPVITELSPALGIVGITWQRFSLPLAKPLTTAASGSWPPDGLGHREGLLVSLTLSSKARTSHPAGPLEEMRSGVTDVALACGVGEVSPLPGLHQESLQEAERQLALVSELFRTARLPRTVALLGGRLSRWLGRALGFDPAQLHPSVR